MASNHLHCVPGVEWNLPQFHALLQMRANDVLRSTQKGQAKTKLRSFVHGSVIAIIFDTVCRKRAPDATEEKKTPFSLFHILPISRPRQRGGHNRLHHEIPPHLCLHDAGGGGDRGNLLLPTPGSCEHRGKGENGPEKSETSLQTCCERKRNYIYSFPHKSAKRTWAARFRRWRSIPRRPRRQTTRKRRRRPPYRCPWRRKSQWRKRTAGSALGTTARLGQ